MRNKLQKSVERESSFSSITMFKNRNFRFAFTLFLLISVKGFAQLNETFDSGIPATWTLIGNGVGGVDWSTTTDGYLSTNGVSINPSSDNIGDQNTAQYFLVTPQIAVPENGEIQFYTKQASDIDNGAQYQIRLSTAAQPDVNGFNITLQSYTESTLNIGDQTTYEKKVIEIPTSIPAGLNIYIAFVTINTQNGAVPTGDEWFVDEVSILEGCIEVDDDTVTIDSITVDTAEVTWSHPTTTNFEIQIIPAGGVPADSGISVTGTSYSLMNLDPETEFDIYIAAICDNDTQSTFTGPYTFETSKYGLSCAEPIVVPDISTTPYVLADNLANWVNPDEEYPTQGTNCLPGNSIYNYLRGDKVFLTYTPTQDGLVTITQTTFDTNDPVTNCYNPQSSVLVYDSCASVGVNCIAGTATVNGNEPKAISNLFVEAGQTYVIVVSSFFGTGAGICFELEISAPACAPPADFEYNNLTENSVAYSWDNIGGFSEAWEYIVVPAGSGEPTGSGTPTTTNVGNVINTGLIPATAYDLYARSMCNGIPGAWSIPNRFTTQCPTFDTPYFTDFDTATPENPETCWTAIDKNKDGTTWTFIGGWATVATSIARYENNDIYASPRVNLDGTPKRVRYKVRSNQGASTYTLKLSTTGVGYDDFTTVLLPTTTITNTTFDEIIVDIPETITGEVNIAWIVEPNTTETGNRILFDEVYIEDKPSCPDPLNPFVIQITANSAWFFWTAGDEESQWEVVIQDLDTGIPTVSGVLTSSNFPYMATGLDSGNRYEYYVRAVCAEDDLSQWVGPVPFTTLCTSYDTPFYESFDDSDPDTQKFCWKITDSNNDDIKWTIDGTHAILSTASFTPPTSFNDYLISPKINLDGTPKALTFKVRADFSLFASATRFGLEVLMSTTNTSPGSFSVISPLEIITNSSYEERTIIVEGTGAVYFAFRVPPQFTGPWSDLSIDDVRITDAPTCPNPTDLVVNTVLTDAADLSWTAGYQETSWNIAVQLAGSGIPTSGIAESTTGYIASDLTPNTEYEYYVQADCGDTTSEWVGPIIFRTLCTAFTTPFVETFNYDSTSEDCWQIVNNNGDIYWWGMDNTAFSYEGDQAAAIGTTTNGASDDWLISPTITVTENQRLRFYYRVTYDWGTEDLEVLLSTNGTGLDQFTTVLYDSGNDPVVINNENYLVKIINLPDGIVGDVNIAFHVPEYPPNPEGYRGLGLIIDNINIEDRPECAEPTNVTFANIIDTEVLVGWDVNGSETEWEVSVQPSGTPAPVGDTDPSYLYTATSNPFLVTGLTASTSYEVYIRAVCDSSESEWTSPQDLLTKCSFENLCQYTFLLTSGYDISATLDITQNNQVVQSLPFEGEEDEEFTVFLCSGVEFSVHFSTLGSAQSQYDDYQFDILNEQGIVYESPVGLPLGTIVYEGAALCGAISCPQPTDLTISATNVMSWTAGGSETQWEVVIQPLENGTIPQSGTIVSTNSFTPIASDFVDPYATTYEYFVRAICGTDDESYWSGPFEFVRNDDVSTATTLPINSNEFCDHYAADVSFLGATASSETMSCDGDNAGDVWFNFTAESIIHIIEVNGFTGTFYYATGDEAYPDITMTLYKDNGAGNLEELACTYDKALVAMYSSELIVGENYKLRLTLNSTVTNSRKFKVCLSTPSDLCSVKTVNGDFEDPIVDRTNSFLGFITTKVLTGWSSNLLLEEANSVLVWDDLSSSGFEPYEGGQSVQIRTDDPDLIDPNDPEVRGYYRDFDSSEITLFDFSYAHLGRGGDRSLQLFAGPPGGPYTMINENVASMAWTLVTGEYQVPAGQNFTRFIFRASTTDDLGNVIDAVNFVANNEIITEPFTVDCDNNNANVSANGKGTWIPSDSNPGAVAITDANSRSTSITNFVQPGVYTFTWQTSYCSYDIEITYNGISDTPEVTSPVEYCLGDTAAQLTATGSDTYNLMWFTQAVGGTASATAPTPNTSVVNTTSYYAAYVDTEGCEGPRAEIEVVVSDSFTPELTFTYEDTCVVSTVNPTPSLITDFATGGTFTSTTLTVDASTGVIDITSATSGEHEITYTYEGDEDTCTSAGTYIATLNLTAATTPVTQFDYGTSPYCELETTSVLPSVASGFTLGGVYSSASLTVDSATGAIDLSTVTAGSHEVTYMVEADETNCSEAATETATIEITASITPVTDFSYAEDIYCADSSSILPELVAGFTTGGTYSAESGLSLNAATGEINVASSTLGNYNVTYEIAEDVSSCIENTTSTFNITILDAIEVGVEGECNDSDYILTASALNNSFDTSEANYTWKDANGNVVGQNSEVFNVSDYASQNPNASVPLQFSITVDFGGCSITTSYTTERLSCRDIPRGISPDGNGKNDTFDLSGYGVKELNIFNRHGVAVYNFNGTYTKQWHGQTNKGDDLPDGTYFYTIHKDDGSSLTGWVFINRAQ
ncbi:choice-of-anchor J domain-containing protein [Winogradskyella thalassocola]|uniref:Gliding motility-associated C-terminal domain-containing protein n=1 Tax=Winogradskyella thalassocola TaxID=262004 RepID=A0A1G8BKD8_9FLAO|nr:choice-of-anchor J domain-containing protein [Winogradskyella thalassocola]SDH33050.1 gliding motility-associated C-terminal domain-containing protein [Winogradskyella thalassocola]